MNQKLQNIIETIQQSGKLGPEQKKNLIKALQDADKEFEITAFKLDRTEKVKKTTAILLEETIEELEQKRKAVEAQNRELEIEASLERIRTRTMAMHKSDELAETAALFFKQFNGLDLLPGSARTYFSLFDTDTDTAIVWMTQADGTVRPGSHSVPLKGSAQVVKVYQGWKQKEPIIIRDMSRKNLTQYLNFLSTLPHVKKNEALQGLISSPPDRIVFSEATFKYGTVGIMSSKPLSQEAQNTLIRFARVFEQTYTRFLDLQKAEAQAREAEIELALERVRARTMAMHKGDELADTALLLFEQITELGIKPRSCGFLIMDEESESMEDWSANVDEKGKASPVTATLAFDQHPMISEVIATWRKGAPYFIGEIHGKDLQKYYKAVTSQESTSKAIKDKVLAKADSEFTNSFNFGYGMMYVLTPKAISEHEIDIMLRFAKVFKQTYIRFLDLQKAEAQAREAEIQLALERVRARTMAMHKSEELSESVAVLFQQLNELGSTPERMNICIIKEDAGLMEVWSTEQGGKQINHSFNAKLSEPTTVSKIYAGWKKKRKSLIIDQSGKELSDWIRYVQKEMKMPFRKELRHKRRAAARRPRSRRRWPRTPGSRG